MSPVNVRIGYGRVSQRGRQAQQAGPHHIAQVTGLPGARGQGEEFQAQAVALAAHILLDHALFHQAAQQAVSGGLRQPDLLRQLRHALAAVGALT
jgi:hypothetical protein